jgi:hypothetical protein
MDWKQQLANVMNSTHIELSRKREEAVASPTKLDYKNSRISGVLREHVLSIDSL